MPEQEWKQKLKSLQYRCKIALDASRGGYFRKAADEEQNRFDDAAREAEDMLAAHLSNKHRLVT